MRMTITSFGWAMSISAQRDQYYSSAKFSALIDTRNVANARRNYFTWIIIVTLLFCISVACLFYKIFISPNNVNEQTQSLANRTSTTVIDHPKNSVLKFYNPVSLLAGFRKRNGKDSSELTCGESQMQEALPSVYFEKIFRNDFENMHDYINADLLLYYDIIINKYPPRTLKLIFNEYQQKLLLVKEPEDLKNFLENLESNKFKYYVSYVKQQYYDLKLENFESFFVLTDELNHWYNYLDRFRGFLFSYEQQKVREYSDNCTEKNFDKFTEETQKRLFHFAYPFKVSEKKLLEINELISECTQPLKIDFYNCSITLYNRVVLLSDVNKKILELNISCLENVYIFASNTIYLDENLNLFGVNLALVAPNWVFLKKIKINLNGIEGRNHENKTSYPLQPGEPGHPGGNGGDFIAVGNPHEKFLIISANGGKGGNGQNGLKGHDGVDNTHPGSLVDKPVCLTKIQTFNNSFGEIITHYKIYNELGCGGSGTDGGVGGVGGAGGIITLIKKNSVKVTKGLNGANGMPGKGGIGGVGGRNGCFYEVLDVNDEILHRVTRVKCPAGNKLPAGKFGKDNFNSRGQIFPPAKANFSTHVSLLQFVRFAGNDFIKYDDADVLLLLKRFNEQDVCNEINRIDMIAEYKMLETFNKFELYYIFIEKIKCMENLKSVQPALKYLKAIVLGKMLVLKKNIDFFFIDLNNYLNFLKQNVMNTNEYTREMQSLSYFKKKIWAKGELIILNLKKIKTKLVSLGLLSEDYKVRNRQIGNPAKVLEEKRILCVTIATIDTLYGLLNQSSNEADLRYFNLTKSCPINFVIESHKKFLNQPSITNSEKTVFKALENLANTNEEEVKKHLAKLKDALCFVKKSDALSDSGKNLLGALTTELEHFIALYNFIEWESLENVFSTSLLNIPLNKNSSLEENEEIRFLRTQLFDVMIAVQYKLAVDIAGERLYPFVEKNQLFSKEVGPNNVIAQMNLLQDIARQNVYVFCKNYERAVFHKNSAIDEFYFWPNEEIKNELKNLFLGAEIKLKADLINQHVFDKNFIQFTSIKLEFECRENARMSEKHLQEILSNFKIDITHSGYSYYNWKGETQIVISEKVSLDYSFRMRENKEPEIYNSLYKKCQNAEIKLSPFTTWTVRLLPINNAADFSKLMPFAHEVNLRLTGTGTYMS